MTCSELLGEASAARVVIGRTRQPASAAVRPRADPRHAVRGTRAFRSGSGSTAGRARCSRRCTPRTPSRTSPSSPSTSSRRPRTATPGKAVDVRAAGRRPGRVPARLRGGGPPVRDGAGSARGSRTGATALAATCCWRWATRKRGRAIRARRGNVPRGGRSRQGARASRTACPGGDRVRGEVRVGARRISTERLVPLLEDGSGRPRATRTARFARDCWPVSRARCGTRARELAATVSQRAVEMARRIGDRQRSRTRSRQVRRPCGSRESRGTARDRDRDPPARAGGRKTRSGSLRATTSGSARFSSLGTDRGGRRGDRGDGAPSSALRQPAQLWILVHTRAMRALLTGSFDEAEELIEEALLVR